MAEDASCASSPSAVPAKIEIAKREGRLRISPHFYNTEEQIDQLLGVLPGH